jgi:ferredoxin
MANTVEYPRSAPGSTISKIVVDRDLCIAAVSCMAVAMDTYELDAENKIIVKDANSIDDATLIASAESCPTKAILLYGNDGSLVFPK